MALTNIFREPRREITEQIVGIVPIALFLFGDWKFSLWFQRQQPHPGWPDIVLGMMVGLLIPVLIGIFSVLLLFFTHYIREEICDSLAARGLELRPKNRR
jgi:polyferredoxin